MRVGAGSKADPKLFEVFGTLLWSRFVRSLLLSCSMSTSAAPVRSGEHTRHSPDRSWRPKTNRSPKATIDQEGPLRAHTRHSRRARTPPLTIVYLDETRHVSESSSTHTRAPSSTGRFVLPFDSGRKPHRHVSYLPVRVRTRGHPKEYPFVTLAHYIAVLL